MDRGAKALATNVKLTVLTVAGVGLAWAAAFFGPAAILALVALPALVALLVARRNWVHVATLAGLSPLAAATVLAVVSYCRGSARLLTSGLPSLESHNLDPQTRLQRVSSGCLVDGSELVQQVPNNAVVRVLSGLFGPMPGAYDGPFPSLEESEAALSAARSIAWQSIRSDLISVGNDRVRVRAGLGAALSALMRREAPEDIGDPRAVLWRHRVLLIELRTSELGARATRRILVDARSGKVIAYYGFGGLAGREFPRQWT